MKTALAIGVVSEILLVVGVVLIGWGIYRAAGSSVPMGPCTMIICVFYTHQIMLSDFYLGFALLIASAIGFTFILWSYRRNLVPPSGATN